MKLSIVIVNYNVKHFLEQCLHSVAKAAKEIECEVFVVDNNSVDGSVAMLKAKFPQIKLIENKENFGFSKANNQAIRIASGEYILLLNPDTVVEEDTFRKVVRFMDDHPDAGGLGVKMIDGKGRFLPESKRALPKPSVAFYKISGLSKLFPGSRTFGQYHLGYLDNNQINEVEVLSGAFMLLRKETLDKIGLLDEDFFMYGEDIDLSYRVIKAGYKNYYFPDTTIIHYKGESTKKGSINYVVVFYNAMIIFAKKHFSQKNAKLFSSLINTSIYLRAAFALFARFVRNFLLPILDALAIYLGYYFVKPYWEHYKFPDGGSYPEEFLLYAVPAYIIIWLGSVFFAGGYEKPVKVINLLKGFLIGTGLILLIYALLSEEFRFSRALILIGAGWALLSTIGIRIIMHYSGLKPYRLKQNTKKKIIIVGNENEATRVAELLQKSTVKHEMLGFVSPDSNGKITKYIGNIDQLNEIVSVNKINEIVFCARDVTSQVIIRKMLLLSDDKVDYKIASPDSFSIIGSNSIGSSGDLYIINLNSIAKESNRRNKRLLDIICSLLFISLFPILAFIVRKPGGFIRNILRVLSGNYSWVGYYTKDMDTSRLPEIRKGILSPGDKAGKRSRLSEPHDRINILYAKDYKLYNDLYIIYKGFVFLGE